MDLIKNRDNNMRIIYLKNKIIKENVCELFKISKISSRLGNMVVGVIFF